MARIRTVKPDAWEDERIGGVTRDARLLWVVLITMADDDGRLRPLPMAIAGHGYPYDEGVDELIPGWLDELAVAGLVLLYEVAGARYACLPRWHSHQRINRKTDSKLPAPPEGSVTPHGALSEPSPPEGKGRERKGKEEDMEGRSAPSAVASHPEVTAVLNLMEGVGLPFSGPEPVEKLVADHPQVDIVAAAEKCAEWARGKSGVRHPLRALLPFVTAADAPEKRQADPALAAYANIGTVDDGSGS